MMNKASSIIYNEETYLRRYYAAFDAENQQIASFLREATKDQPGRYLDLGIGPSFLFWALVYLDATERYGVDLLLDNIDQVRVEMTNIQSGQISEVYRDVIRFAAGDEVEPVSYAQQIVKTIAELTVADLTDPWRYKNEQFDVVTSCFCMENLPFMSGYHLALDEAFRVLRPGGRLVLAMLGETSRRRCGGWHQRAS